MYLGDNLIKEGIVPLVERFLSSKADTLILLAHVLEPERFGVARLEGDRVVELIEKPKDPPSDLALVGVYMFRPVIMDAARAIQPSWRGELEITDAIQYLIYRGDRVESHLVDGWWKDTGKLEDLLEANRMVLEGIEPRCEGHVDSSSQLFGRVEIEEGAEVINSVIRGPAIIGKRARIVNSFVGPFTSIYYDVLLENSEIEHSIVMEKSRITDVGRRIEDSLIGKDVEITRSPLRPEALRLMLGDNSRIGLI